MTTELLDRVKAWFDAKGWPYEEGSGLLRTNVAGRNGQWPCGAQVTLDGLVLFSSVLPDEVPEARLGPMMEAVTRANCGLTTGAFELDLDDGGVRFRTSLDSAGDPAALSEPQLERLIIRNVSVMDRYLPAFRSVIAGDEPATAIQVAESA